MAIFEPLQRVNGGNLVQENLKEVETSAPKLDSQLVRSVWQSISKWLPAQDDDCKFWWEATGPKLAALLAHADYTVHQQYEFLLFHYHVVVPRLGPRPSPSSTSPSGLEPKWKSFMTDEHSPIEFSWKWDTGKQSPTGELSGPDIRYGIEPVGRDAGTKIDPLNLAITRAMLHQLNLSVPDIDLTWFHHFDQVMFGDDAVKQKERKETFQSVDGSTSSKFLAIELLKGELAIKAYFILPSQEFSNETGNEVKGDLLAAIRSLDTTHLGGALQWEALDGMLAFMKTEAGRHLTTFMVAVDCVKPSKSRLKIYVRSPETSFDSVVNILTVGGKRTVSEDNLLELKELWRLTLGLAIGFSTSEDLPVRDHATSGVCYHIDIKPGTCMPDIKIYIPVRHYAVSDLKIAHGLAEFLGIRGRAKHADGYIKSLQEFAPLDQLETSCGIQTYISAAFKNDELSMTSYFSPNIYGGK